MLYMWSKNEILKHLFWECITVKPFLENGNKLNGSLICVKLQVHSNQKS